MAQIQPTEPAEPSSAPPLSGASRSVPPSGRRAAAPEAGVPASAAPCAHCGEPVPADRQSGGAEPAFCCAGCQIVFGMLRRHALEGYYEYVERDGGARPALATGRDYAELDDPRFLALYALQHGEERTLELLLEGVHCAACVWLVEKLPELVPGVTECRLDFARRLARVSFRDGSELQGGAPGAPAAPAAGERTTASAIARALDSLGYPPHPHRDGERLRLQRREERQLLVRMGVAGASAGNSMLFALALYSGAFADMEAAQLRYFRLLSALVALPAVTWSAQVFYRGALAALRARRPHMDLPLSLGIGLGVVWGLFNVIRGEGEVYFDSLSTLVFVLLAARFVQVRQQARAELALGSAQALTPRSARQLGVDGASSVVPAESVPSGARVEVLAGDTFPVDGRVEHGASSADVSWLTGESAPQPLGAGSAVYAGTTNLGSRVVVVAERSGAETRAARLWQEVERASLRRAPIALVADRAAGRFLVGALLLALTTFLIWLPSGVGVAVQAAIALLVVTCPCGLALATPLTVSAALGQAARAGWLIKGGAALEALARPGLVVFDKTGTLTEGRLSVVRWYGDRSLGPVIKALESTSSHPIARALVSALADVPAASVEQVEQQLGSGVKGWSEGSCVSVGAVHAVREPLPEWAESALAELAREGLTPVVACVDGAARAIAALGDPIRPEAAGVLRRLRESGQRLALLSGDQQAVVDHVVRALERESRERLFETARGDVSPEGKLAFVERARVAGAVFMVGDGVNDAAALAAASVGVAVHGGAEASLQAAHVFATRPGVLPLLELLQGARRALGVIHTNLALSLVYNVAAAALCVAGAITPLWAAVIMPLSSLTVVSHSYRRRMFGGKS